MARISLTAQAAGKRIREYREEKKWTINKMAAFACMDAKHLKKLEDALFEGTFLSYIHLMEWIGYTNVFVNRKVIHKSF